MDKLDSFLTLFNSISDLALLIDKSGKIIGINQSMLDYIEQHIKNLQHRNIFEIFTPSYDNNRTIDIFFNSNNNTLVGKLSIIGNSESIFKVKAIKNRNESETTIVLIFIEINKPSASEEMFRKVFYRNSIPMLLSSVFDGTIIDINDSGLDLFEYKREQIIGERVISFISEFSNYNREEVVATLLKNGIIKAIDVKIRSNQGTYIDCIISLSLFELDNNKYILTSINDISKIIEYDKQLKMSNQKFHAIFNNSPFGILLFNSTGNILEINQTAKDIFGVKEIKDNYTFFDDKYINMDIKSRIINKEIVNIEIQYDFDKVAEFSSYETNKSGQIYLDLTFIPITVEDLGLCFLLKIVDITDKRKQAELLSDTLSQYKSLFESMTPGVVYQDAQGNIIKANPSAELILGRTAEELIHKTSEDNDWQSINEDGTELLGSNHPAMIALRTGKPVHNYVMRIYNASKNIHKWLKVNAIPQFKVDSKKPFQVFATFDDITLQKNGEEKLRKSEEYLFTLLKAIPDFVYVTDLDGTIIMLPNEVFKQFGFKSKDELLGHNIKEFLVEADYQRAYGNLKLLERGISTGPDAYHIVNPDGQLIPIEANAELLLGADREPIGYLIVDRDISYRVEAENEIKKLRKGIDNSPVSIVITNSNGDIEYVNPKFCEITGYTIEEVIGQNTRILKSGKMTTEVYEKLWETLLSGNSWTGELQNVKKNGEFYWESVSISPIKDKSEYITNFIAIKEDITQRKYNETQQSLFVSRLNSIISVLEYSGDNLQDFLDFALGQAIELTKSKIGYIYYYDEGEKLFTLNSWSKEVMKVCTIQEKLSEYDLDKTGIWGEAVRQRKPIMINDFTAHNELKKGYPEGHAPLFKFLTIPIFNNGKIESVVGVGNKESDYDDTDILQLTILMDAVWKVADKKRTDVKIQELLKLEIENKELMQVNLLQKNSLIEELENTKIELENTLKEKDKFFSIIAHDLRSPFTGFLGYTRIMAEEMDELSITEIQEISHRMQESANSLYALLENLLEWTRIKKTSIELVKETQMINTLISSNINIIKARADIKAINIHFDQVKDVYLKFDKNTINTVIRNLLSNAVKFTNSGGNIYINITENINDAIIEIRDTGIGMSEDLKSKLFNISQKTIRQGTANETSTGIGLLLCKEYVELNSGSLRVESNENTGSSFIFSIPK